ncbi:unnamed protein product [Rotaria magnacalcarata]|uniref:Uncharacterized protein n=1 Tax=Rotaria magnacalcarata TaxID=392030 RepID=A0A818XWE4_9BILA|nr:unnamed protein product [Rotaria magnacalcarata]CAF2164573.1 unnamed protein product [Rotaria magnacalcarata]CAF3742408.1 unnamed protein product [Rotaria magnacalcarata]CAF3955639.1 unnamed protein product [Rotaria magnacalcarata]
MTYCTDVSSLSGVAVGQRSDIVSLSKSSSFSPVYASTAWSILTLGEDSWSISSHINLVRRPDNGMFNNASIAAVMSQINIQQNHKTLITVSVSDPDGDTIRCRWANSSNGVDECVSICPPGSLPVNTAIYSNCTVEIIGASAASGYAIALMICYILIKQNQIIIFVFTYLGRRFH